MSKLPRTDDLPTTAQGYDAARVEEAFSAFADRVAEVEADEEETPLSLDERRRAIHEKAQQALGEMNRPGRDD
jgi:hypothetical protein